MSSVIVTDKPQKPMKDLDPGLSQLYPGERPGGNCCKDMESSMRQEGQRYFTSESFDQKKCSDYEVFGMGSGHSL